MMLLLPMTLAFVVSQQAPPVDFTKFKPYTAKSNEGDFIIGAPYSDARELEVRPEVPKGAIYRFTMDSTESKIYPGIAKTAPGQVVPRSGQLRRAWWPTPRGVNRDRARSRRHHRH